MSCLTKDKWNFVMHDKGLSGVTKKIDADSDHAFELIFANAAAGRQITHMIARERASHSIASHLRSRSLRSLAHARICASLASSSSTPIL